MEADFARLIGVQQWLYREARLLDERRFDLWLELLHADVRYRVPARRHAMQADVRDFAAWSPDHEVEAPTDMALIDDDLAGLRLRIGRLQTAMAWAEMPASMARRLVGNVLIDGEAGGVVSVVSTLFLSKVRECELPVGARGDPQCNAR